MAQIGRNTPADIKLSAAGGGSQISYKASFNFFSVRMVVPQADVSTFADEPNTKYEPQELVCVVSFAGLLQNGAGAVATLLLPPAQNVQATWQFAAGCTVAGNFNMEDSLAARPVNANATIAGTARSNYLASYPLSVNWA